MRSPQALSFILILREDGHLWTAQWQGLIHSGGICSSQTSGREMDLVLCASPATAECHSTLSWAHKSFTITRQVIVFDKPL